MNQINNKITNPQLATMILNGLFLLGINALECKLLIVNFQNQNS